MPNDYKKDEGKPPVLEALEPFYPALLGLARMMADMAVKHKLQGASEPFSEWKQLPEAKRRLKRAFGSHSLQGLAKVNHTDGIHLHGYHALFNLLAFLTIHEEDNAETCCAAADAKPVEGPAGADWRELGNRGLLQCRSCGHSASNHESQGGGHIPGPADCHICNCGCFT